MKKLILSLMVSMVFFGCNGQSKEEADKPAELTAKAQNPPQGQWKVNREYDRNGNLIRFDSIYSWSSTEHLDDLGAMARDSVLHSFKSRIYRSFPKVGAEGFPGFFAGDSLLGNRFFEDDFFASPMGRDLMDLDAIQKRMEEMQRRFLEHYGRPGEDPKVEQQG